MVHVRAQRRATHYAGRETAPGRGYKSHKLQTGLPGACGWWVRLLGRFCGNGDQVFLNRPDPQVWVIDHPVA